MTNMPEGGLIALVCYLPEPLNTVVQQFREVLRSSYAALPHITILPPRPLRADVGTVERYIAQSLAPFQEFTVELTDLHSFPATSMLYLSISSGSDVLRKLHQALNSGELDHEEAYEFTPHATVAGPFDPDAIPGLMEQANAFWKSRESNGSFGVRELVLLWTDRDGHGWQALRTFTLRSAAREFLATAANRT
jgi:2'-5' RNA ligase